MLSININFKSTGLQVYKIYHLLLAMIANHALILLGTSITLSPLGIVSVCPGGQVLLTCERVSGSILSWNVSIPHLAGATSHRIIVLASPVVILSPEFRIGFTEFNITRTFDNPLTSQLLINNMYRLHHEVEVSTGFTHRGPEARGCVNRVETEPSDVTDLYHGLRGPDNVSMA